MLGKDESESSQGSDQGSDPGSDRGPGQGPGPSGRNPMVKHTDLRPRGVSSRAPDRLGR